jgi:hypothetical protein
MTLVSVDGMILGMLGVLARHKSLKPANGRGDRPAIYDGAATRHLSAPDPNRFERSEVALRPGAACEPLYLGPESPYFSHWRTIKLNGGAMDAMGPTG